MVKPFATIEEAIAEVKLGRMIVMVDDENRENEGDLVIAAEYTTPEAINFMAQYARGLVCLSLTQAKIDQLGLPMMSQKNQSQFQTAFTVSIEAAQGVTTGISAFDRAHTIQTVIQDEVRSDDIVTPGHVFPLRAEEQGVLAREGHTEGSVDLACLAGLKPAAVLCEIMNPDGTMARLPDLEVFAREHALKIVSIADLKRYRLGLAAGFVEAFVEGNRDPAVKPVSGLDSIPRGNEAYLHRHPGILPLSSSRKLLAISELASHSASFIRDPSEVSRRSASPWIPRSSRGMTEEESRGMTEEENCGMTERERKCNPEEERSDESGDRERSNQPKDDNNDQLNLAETAQARLPVHGLGDFEIKVFHDATTNLDHVALQRTVDHASAAPLVRLHSQCLTGDVFGSVRCDCGWQLQHSLLRIAKEGGALLYLAQEGRGIGLANKIKAYALQDSGLDTVEANHCLGFADDLRDYEAAAHILDCLALKNIRILTNNPGKIAALKRFGLTVQREPIEMTPQPENAAYLAVKRSKLGHLLELVG